jgi:hypothetical protein
LQQLAALKLFRPKLEPLFEERLLLEHGWTKVAWTKVAGSGADSMWTDEVGAAWLPLTEAVDDLLTQLAPDEEEQRWLF